MTTQRPRKATKLQIARFVFGRKAVLSVNPTIARMTLPELQDLLLGSA